MKKFIWKLFVKDYENYRDPVVRARYTRLTGVMGIITNCILCAIKVVVGTVLNSVAVIVDGVNDLADSLTSCITLVGAKIAGKPADSKHPYGHARVEYLVSLVVSAIVLIVGYQLMVTSIDRCLHPAPLEFSWPVIGAILAAIVLKGLQALFTIATGKHIDSLPVIGAGKENRNDVVSSIIIVAGLLVYHYTGVNLDGYLGCVVSLLFLYTGFQLIRETVGPIIGMPPDRERVEAMCEIISEHPQIIGVHDIVIYSYGPGREFSSFHAEVDSREDMMEIHDLIDDVEQEIMEKLGIKATCHMDPVEVDNPIRLQMQEVIGEAIKKFPQVESFHDLRVVPGKTHTNIIFDLVIQPGARIDKEAISAAMDSAAKAADPTFNTVVNFDNAYI